MTTSKSTFFYLSSVIPDDPNGGAQHWQYEQHTLHGTSIQAYPNPDVTWEKSRKSNIAIEATILKISILQRNLS